MKRPRGHTDSLLKKRKSTHVKPELVTYRLSNQYIDCSVILWFLPCLGVGILLLHKRVRHSSICSALLCLIRGASWGIYDNRTPICVPDSPPDHTFLNHILWEECVKLPPDRRVVIYLGPVSYPNANIPAIRMFMQS